MGKAPLPEDEKERLKALDRYKLLDSAAEEQFDDIVRLASQICETPISLISLIDSKRQWFKSKEGLDVTETSRDHAFCAHGILDDQVLEVEDARQDERFKDNPLVTGDPDIRFYAGAPLITHDHYRLGTLCVIDRVPRNLTDHQKFALQVLAAQVVKLLELRYQNLTLSRSLQTVSEQKKRIQSLLQERVKLVEELENSSHIKDQMLSIIAHDLRSPLATLQNLLMLVSEKPEDIKDKLKYTAALGKSVEGAVHLLENLLQWGMTQLDGNEPEKIALNLYSLVQQLQEELQPAADAKNNNINNLVPPNCTIFANHTTLSLVLRNLLMNANKFTSEGNISIRAVNKEKKAHITIEDTGVGMDEEMKINLFKLNKKNNRTGTANEKGTGLGLHMSREVLQKMGGSLEIESEKDKGTSVTVSLPA